MNVVCLLIVSGVIAGVQAVLRGLGWSDAMAELVAIVAGAVVFGAFFTSGLLDNTWGKKTQGQRSARRERRLPAALYSRAERQQKFARSTTAGARP